MQPDPHPQTPVASNAPGNLAAPGRCTVALQTASLILAMAPPVSAAFIAPSWRPADFAQAAATLTTHQGWDAFASPSGPNNPDTADLNPNGVADAFETSGMSFVTGGGNIYSPTVAITMQVRVPGFGPSAEPTEFIVQLRTQGNELDTASLQIDGQPAADLEGYAYTELERVPLGGFGGSLVEHRFAFTLPDSASDYTLTWQGAQSSVSQDAIAIDTRVITIPEPGVLATTAVGGPLLTGRRRSRRRVRA